MTAVSGFAQNFIHLLLARIGVAIGEAGGSPPAHAMVLIFLTGAKSNSFSNLLNRYKHWNIIWFSIRRLDK